MDPGIVSLADILGTRIADHVPQTPNKISEDMIKCIASIYIRIRDFNAVQHPFFPSPCSSFSSASGLSSKYTGDIWSPRCRKEGYIEAWQDDALGTGESRYFSQQYDSVIEVSALCKGAQRSADVKDMLISGQRVNPELIEYHILCCRVHSPTQVCPTSCILQPPHQKKKKNENIRE
jgi:hypothetical protein